MHFSDCISIIIPTKNRCVLLQDTLTSLFKQNFNNWEAVIVDDGSTDETQEYITSHVRSDSRFKYFQRSSQLPGASSCRNLGLSKSRGDYVIFLDSDDLLDPDCLQDRFKAIHGSDFDFVVFMTRVFRNSPGDDQRLWNSFTSEDDLDRFLTNDMPWHTSGPIWKRTTLDTIGPWDESCHSAQDWEFHIRALTSGLKYHKISKVDSSWRSTRRDSISSNWDEDTSRINRSKTIAKTTKILKLREFLSERRRRMIAALCYREAFSCHGYRQTLQIWNAAIRSSLIKPSEYILLILLDALHRKIRKLNGKALTFFFPESKKYITHLKNPALYKDRI